MARVNRSFYILGLEEAVADNLTGKRILIVDDEPDVLEMLEEL